MLVIRFLRQGKKHQPFYKIVVVEKNKGPHSGKFVEQVGFYNPLTKEKDLNKERILYWISKGAQLSDTIHNMLVSNKIIQGEKRRVHSMKPKEEEKPVEESKEETAEEKSAEEPKEEPKEEVGEEKSAEEENKEEVPAEEKKEETSTEEKKEETGEEENKEE